MTNRGECVKTKSTWNMDTTNQMTSLVSPHLISGNHTLNSGNGLCKQIGPGPFPGNQSTQMRHPAEKDLHLPYASSPSTVEIQPCLSPNQNGKGTYLSDKVNPHSSVCTSIYYLLIERVKLKQQVCTCWVIISEISSRSSKIPPTPDTNSSSPGYWRVIYCLSHSSTD